MTRMSDIYRSDTAKPQDIPRPIRKRIKKTEVREFPDFRDQSKRKPRLVLTLEDFSQDVVVNGYAAPVLLQAFGDDVANYVGREIVLFTQSMYVAGRMMDVIMIRLPRQQPAAPAPEEPPPQDPADFDDDIPF